MSIAADHISARSVYSAAMDDTGRVLSRAHALAEEFLAGLDARPVWPRATFEEMLAALGGPLPEAGEDPVAVVERLAATADPGLSGTAGPRFFGFVIGGSLPAALGADVLTSVWDQNAGINALTPAAAAAEVVAGEWIVEALGLPAGYGGRLRHRRDDGQLLLPVGGAPRRAGPPRLGRRGARALRGPAGARRGRPPPPRHRSTAPCATSGSARTRSSRSTPTTRAGSRSPALEATLAAGDGPTIVCLQAGEVHTGAFDDFAAAIPVARKYDAWVHVDGAFGLWAAASPSYRHLTVGLDDADSWATDAHKTLNVPYDSGLALVRDPATLAAGFGVVADYLIGAAGDPMERTPEFSRRARGFPVWAALRSLGSRRPGRPGRPALLARHRCSPRASTRSTRSRSSTTWSSPR